MGSHLPLMAPFIWSFEDGIIAKTNCKQYLTENAEAVEFSILGAWSNQMYLVNIICYNEALYRKGLAFPIPFINDNNNINNDNCDYCLNQGFDISTR